MLKKVSLFSVLTSSLLTINCIASPINLYDQPNPNAKLIGKIETDTGIIPIFSPKNSDWIKVGDPTNGNSGWIKQSDLKAISGVTFTQNMIYTGKGPKVIQTQTQVDYGNTVLPQQEIDKFTEKMLERQKAVQKYIQETLQLMSGSRAPAANTSTPASPPTATTPPAAKP